MTPPKLGFSVIDVLHIVVVVAYMIVSLLMSIHHPGYLHKLIASSSFFWEKFNVANVVIIHRKMEVTLIVGRFSQIWLQNQK
jgi:hypothetical protein